MMSQDPKASEDNDSPGRVSKHDFSMALETLMNLIYLMEIEAGHAAHVKRYALMAGPPLAKLSRVMSEMPNDQL